MKLTEEKVRQVSALANLWLSDTEVHSMSEELGNILTHIEQLNELDTTDVEPMAQVLFDADDRATLREDVICTPLSNEGAIGNAASSGAGYFKVPKVIDR